MVERALLGNETRGATYAAELDRKLGKGPLEEPAKIDRERTSSLARVLGGGLDTFLRLRGRAPESHELLSAVEDALDTAVVLFDYFADRVCSSATSSSAIFRTSTASRSR